MHELAFLRVIVDQPDECPYLPAQTARLPLCIPTCQVTGPRLDALLESGYRRSGFFFYRPRCPNCQACEALRINVARFQPSRSQRRARKLGDRLLEIRWQAPQLDGQRLALFNKHRRLRGLDHERAPASLSDYQSFLLNAACPVIELDLFYEQQLVAVSIADVGRHSLSAVYCYFDPDLAWLGLGTYAILCQLELVRQAPPPLDQSLQFAIAAAAEQDRGQRLQGLEALAQAVVSNSDSAVDSGWPSSVASTDDTRWLYLGLHVSENRHLNYKSRFMPHERLQAGHWQPFQRQTRSGNSLP